MKTDHIPEGRKKVPAGAGRLDQPVRRVLHLTLKRRWFEMIASGVKREEYRAMKPYWHKRLNGRSYDAVHFRNGYSKDSPCMLLELRDIGSGLGVLEWGAPLAQSVYILRLGAMLQAPNVGGEARLAAHQPSQTTTATPQGVASTDQLGGRFRSE